MHIHTITNLCCNFKPQLNTLSDKGKIPVSSVKHTYIHICIYILKYRKDKDFLRKMKNEEIYC